MSLKVWLPLNGNFNNQGLGKFDTGMKQTNVVFEPGKIGNNPVFSADATNYVTCQELIGASAFTICFFIKATDNQTFTTWSDVFNATNFRVELNSTSGNAINLFGFGYDNSGLGQMYINKEWHHIVYTYKDSTFTGYCDGIQKVKRTVQTPGTIWSGKFRLGDSANSYFQLADFRIYDECLSQKQIKEIAKGLVCHYKFDGTRANENLISKSYTSSWDANGTNTFTKLDDYSFSIEYTTETVGSSNGRYKSINGYFTEGKTYTFSYDIKGNGEYKMKCGFEGQYNYLTTLTDFKRYSSTYTASSTGWKAIVFYSDSNNNLTTGSIITVKNMKLEEGTVATQWIPNSTDSQYAIWGYDKIFKQDCSGYNYIGTQYGTLTYNLDSPRYDGSTYFNGSALLNNSLGTVLANSKDFTISGWFNRTSGTSYYAGASSSTVPVCLENARFFIYSASGALKVGNWSCTNNIWQHLTLVHNSATQTLTLYINGIQNQQITTDGTIYNGETLNIGGRNNSGQFVGSISDFRIYTTALPAEEILTLYKNSGIIDNNNNVYAREFKEV